MPTILVVDDEEPVRQLLAAIFTDRGYRALQARNGRHALEVLNGERPDLVLTDVMMPMLTGADLCRYLKADPATQAIPVILMSAAGREVTDGSGADDYLDKPFYLNEVEALVDRWLAHAGGHGA
jgi:two-component system, OmpR family, alkaline phosphatase synthesis response regulator PhoP